jgi:hypothetical protein
VDKKGEAGWINVTPLKIPASLAAHIVTVAGFDRMHQNAPAHHATAKTSAKSKDAPLAGNDRAPSIYSPQDLRDAYNIDAIGLDGKGVKVGVVFKNAPSRYLDIKIQMVQ